MNSVPARGVLGSIAGGCWPFHFPLFCLVAPTNLSRLGTLNNTHVIEWTAAFRSWFAWWSNLLQLKHLWYPPLKMTLHFEIIFATLVALESSNKVLGSFQFTLRNAEKHASMNSVAARSVLDSIFCDCRPFHFPVFCLVPQISLLPN